MLLLFILTPDESDPEKTQALLSDLERVTDMA